MHDWKLIIPFFSCHHSLCGTVGRRVADLAGRAPAERPASTGGASRVRWSLSCPTPTRAPTPAAGSILWTSKSTCRCLCSTYLNAMAPPSTSLNSAARTLPWPHVITAIRKMMRLRRWGLWLHVFKSQDFPPLLHLLILNCENCVRNRTWFVLCSDVLKWFKKW